MIIYPAIDLYEGKAVRLLKGDYDKMTVYSDDPAGIAADFMKAGARRIHVVDLGGARDGGTPNLETVLAIREAALKAASETEAVSVSCAPAAPEPDESKEFGSSGSVAADRPFVEIGGGIRDLSTAEKYLEAGIDRVILGTAAVKDPEFLKLCVGKYAGRVAVGIDVKDGFVAVKGWTELSEYRLDEFAAMMQDAGVSNIICTDISKDGAMQGTSREMYRRLSETLDIEITASGGVSSIDDIKALAALGIHGAIIGKAYYTGAIDLAEAVKAAETGAAAGSENI